uniref:cAMP-regulated phosphoprotein 21 n=1 Tax=Monopterus albus TaxID=43700 RepID=UPI0009B382DD|nr:cAMP-regulated phosphoprotein 21 [Monopterus albus]XP_020462576.1 cAMP-regulated phosphoprotein 21 [Monopterus albus]XP_020462577.1 cAMP-regulated phosphoprotein 21 [Monopterus albus]
MTEAAVESAEVLQTPSDVMSCDVISCPTSPPLMSLCTQREDDGCHHDRKKLEQQKLCNQVQPKKKVKTKGKLVRSMAVCEESSPFDETPTSPDANISSSCHDNERTSCKDEEQEKGTDPKKHSLSKESSVEYTDSTGIDLHQFIIATLNSNPRDRMMLLKLEQDMIDFIASNSPYKKFPHMSSYHRMLVHRVAAYFGMDHNVDQTGKSVIINRTSSTRIPEQRFLDKVHKDKTEDIHRWKIILKRDNNHSDDQTRLHPLREKQSKSVEEREEEYQRARERIFSKEPLCPQESTHAETRAVEEYNPYAETQRRRQLFRASRDSSGSSWTSSSRQSSTEIDCRYGNDPRPWSSTDSDSSFQWAGPALKPHQSASRSWEARGSGSIALFRLPPTCPHASSPPVIEELTPSSTYIMENGIPPGSILVNPHTGQPFLNPDGTPAVYNPPDVQQTIRSQTQLQGSPTQQQQQQMVQYSSVSYTAPQMLPVTPSQPYTTTEDLSSRFAHVTVSCPSLAEAPPLYPPSQGYIYAAPPPPPPPANPTSYCQPSPQMPVYYYGQYPTSTQHGCRPVSPSQHLHSQVAQPAGYAPVVGLQQSSPSQAQAVLGTYSPMASHQCSMVQGGVSLSNSQSKVGSGVGGEAAYCCVVPLPSHHSGCHPPSCTNLSAQAWNAQY